MASISSSASKYLKSPFAPDSPIAEITDTYDELAPRRTPDFVKMNSNVPNYNNNNNKNLNLIIQDEFTRARKDSDTVLPLPRSNSIFSPIPINNSPSNKTFELEDNNFILNKKGNTPTSTGFHSNASQFISSSSKDTFIQAQRSDRSNSSNSLLSPLSHYDGTPRSDSFNNHQSHTPKDRRSSIIDNNIPPAPSSADIAAAVSSARSVYSNMSTSRSNNFQTPRESTRSYNDEEFHSNRTSGRSNSIISSDNNIAINIGRIKASEKVHAGLSGRTSPNSVISQHSQQSNRSSININKNIMQKYAPDPDVPLSKQEMMEILFSKIRNNHLEQVEEIINSKAIPIDTRDNFGNTVLHVACQNGNKKIAKMILRVGANINAQNFKGCTPLHYCFSFKYEQLGEYLISKGAKDTIVNNVGLTCYEGVGLD